MKRYPYYTLYMIIVYSADWCAYCVAVKDYFTTTGVEFEERNIEKDEAFMKEAVDKSGQMGIPVIDINGEIIVGFDKPKIDAAIAK